VFTALAARRRFASLGAEAPLAVWALGSAVIVLALGRALAADPFLAACVAAWWAFAPSPWAAVALGLGFLAKGPVVLVPTVAAVLVASIGPGGRDARRLLGPAWGWALFAAIALGWYLLLAANVPGLLGYWLGDQIVGRYASTRHARSGSPLYFVVVLIAGMLPWTPALVRGIGRAVSERARVEARLLLAWLLVPTLFLSFSGSKLPGYLLPAAPAAALLVAIGWRECGRVWRGVMALVLVAVAAAGWILGPRAFAGLVGLETPARVPLPFAAHAALFAIAYAATWVWRARLAPAAALFTTGVVLLIAAVSPFEARLGSPRPLARVLAENRQPGEPVVEYRHFAAGFPFYLRERVRLLEVPREVGFDTTERLAGMIVATDSLRVWTERGGRVWIVGPEAPAQELASSLGLQFAPIARTPRTSVGYVSR
jgi:4-amino-4-deoxy-L-arabinose transferase-like glycosyltransferase